MSEKNPPSWAAKRSEFLRIPLGLWCLFLYHWVLVHKLDLQIERVPRQAQLNKSSCLRSCFQFGHLHKAVFLQLSAQILGTLFERFAVSLCDAGFDLTKLSTKSVDVPNISVRARVAIMSLAGLWSLNKILLSFLFAKNASVFALMSNFSIESASRKNCCRQSKRLHQKNSSGYGKKTPWYHFFTITAKESQIQDIFGQAENKTWHF